MAKQRIFISFDYDHDEDIKIMLAGQAKLQDSPFDFIDASVKEPLSGDWKEKVKGRIKNCDQVIVLCGTATNTASGVSAELKITQDLDKPYFLLWGRSSKTCVKPTAALTTDAVYNWTWDNLKSLIAGSR
jgi:hypothetical protein